MDPLLLDKKTAAKALGICLRTIDKLIAVRELPVRKIGKRVLIERSALERFAKRDHVTSAGNAACPDAT